MGTNVTLLSLQWQSMLELLLLHSNSLSSRVSSLPGSTVGNVCEILPLVALLAHKSSIALHVLCKGGQVSFYKIRMLPTSN